MPEEQTGIVTRPAGLADLLDRILDKGLVVAGDIRISLANIELLTVRIRLLVCSIDKAAEIGMDWWRRDAFFSSAGAAETAALEARIAALEQHLAPPAAEIPVEPPARPRRRSPRGRQPGTGG